MKRLVISLLFLLLGTVYVNAQEEVDECNCEETTIHGEAFKVLCDYSGSCGYNPDALTISIKYEVIVCGDRIRVRVTHVHISDFLYNYHNEGCDPDPETMGCPYYPYPDLNDEEALRAWLAPLYYELLPQTNSNQVVVSFPAGCQAAVTVLWPAGTKYTVRDDGGFRTINIGNTVSVFMVPCQTECCVGELNDEGEITYHPIKATGCDGGEPDPNFTPTMTYYPENGGDPIIYTGTIISAGPCMSMCPYSEPRVAQVTPANETGNDPKTVVSAYPTLTNDKISFTSNTPITQVLVYDVQGKQVMQTVPQNNEISLSALQPGIYYLQVGFNNHSSKQIKVCKY